MNRIGVRHLAWSLGVCVLVGLPALGQPPVGGGGAGPDAEGEPAPLSPAEVKAAADEAVSSYMDRIGLKRLRAEQMLDRLRRTQGDERLKLSEDLGRLYVELLAAATDPAEIKRWEDKSRELLRLVPDGETFELRINLAKQIYLRAEQLAEKGRLRLAEPDELVEAQRLLKSIGGELQEIAAKMNNRVDELEKQEETSRGDTDAVRQRLSDSRRVRSLAFYYAGWTDYYLALLNNSDKQAADALRNWGWLLNNRAGLNPTLERVPAALFKYDHVARAGLGVALANSLRGNDVDAVRWLDAVENAEGVSKEVADQIFPRRIAVLGAAKRWADLERAVRLERKAARDGSGASGGDAQPLTTPAARLLAIVTLEAARGPGQEARDALAAVALGDLVTRGELGQVLDLVRRFGTAPLGDTGFIVNVVRGVQGYEQAREAHAKLGNSDEPTTDSAAVNLYDQARALLTAAVGEPDAAKFPGERDRAALQAGLCLYYANRLTQAAEQFASAGGSMTDPKTKEESLWLAVVALDKAARAGDAAAATKRDQAAITLIQSAPDSARAAELLVRIGSTDLIDSETALNVLLGVKSDSALYVPARRQAARILYQRFRGAAGQDKDFAGLRFATLAEELLALERREALSAPPDKAEEAGQRVALRVRQLLDALLSATTPDVARAKAALGVYEEVSAQAPIATKDFDAELMFRRFQIAQGMGDESASAGLLASLEELAARPAVMPDGSRGKSGDEDKFLDAAQRVMYRRVIAAWREKPGDPGVARDVVKYGAPVIERLGTAARALAQPSGVGLYNSVADAATVLWEARGAEASARRPMLELAVKLDRALLEAEPKRLSSLKRQARNAEAAGDAGASLTCWQTLAELAAPGSPDWFETRFHSIRLMSGVDGPKARAALAQIKAVYPDLGPEPWRTRFRELERTLGDGAGDPAPAPAPASPSGPAEPAKAQPPKGGPR
jgi:hypothetical protein